MIKYNRKDDLPNYGDKIFLNNAGSSLMPRSVMRTIKDYLDEELIFGGYKLIEMKTESIKAFYQETAKLLHCEPRNIAFAHDATDAYIKALSSISFKKGDVIITTNNDYPSNQIQFISLKQRYGIQIKRIRSLENGDLDIAHFRELVAEQKPKLVAITHIPTNSGLIQDITTIGKICREQSMLYLVDACQSTGQLNLDVQAIQCDYHK